MPFTMKTTGMEELSGALNALGEAAPAAAALGLYEGAGIMADEVKSSVSTIKTEPFHYAGVPPTQRLPSPEEKEIVMQAAAGIAKFNKNGSEVDTSVGFRNAGYAILAGKTVPIPVIVNAINSGTSFMKKQPFFRKAVSKATPKVKAAIIKKANSILEEYLEAMRRI